MALVLPPGEFLNGYSGEYLCDQCPSCDGRKKFYFNTDKVRGHCKKCNVIVGTWKKLWALFAGQVFVTHQRQEAFDEEVELVPTDLVSVALADPARSYLSGRFVDPKTAHDLGMKYSASQNSLYVPLTPVSDELPMSWQTRKLMPNSYWRNLRGQKASQYYFGDINTLFDVAILVEGVMDVVVPGLYGMAYSFLGSKMSAEQAAWLASNFSAVIVWMDPDLAGDKAVLGVMPRLKAWGIPAFSMRTNYDPGSYAAQHEIPTALRKYVAGRIGEVVR